MADADRRAYSLLAGTGGGVLSGILGGGGGAVMIPLMTGVLKMRQHVAHGTSLVVISFSALASAITYSYKEDIDWALTLLLSVGGLAGAIVGARLSAAIPGLRLRQLLGLFLISVALRLLLVRSIEPVFEASGTPEIAVGAAIGVMGGIASGALGVGGGSIFVPALVLLLGTGQHEAQGISIWAIVAASSAGAYAHHLNGTVDFEAAKWIVPAAVPAGIVGSLIATQLGPTELRAIFATVLVLLGLQMLVTATLRLRGESKQAILQPETDPS